MGIILPIGSTEQHGPTGLIGTDVTVEAIARVEKQLSNSCPTINVGMALHHTAFPARLASDPAR